MTEAFPLKWPNHKPRVTNRENSRFRVGSFAVVRDKLFHELKLLGAKSIVLSTNIPLRNDGLPYASFKTPADPGVAVYFQYNGKPMAFACDRWRSIEENIKAVQSTIEALRGIARWGTGDMLKAAFDGFTALPAPSTINRQWFDVLQVRSDASIEVIKANYKRLAIEHHPDNGGSHNRMAEINAAYKQALSARSV